MVKITQFKWPQQFNELDGTIVEVDGKPVVYLGPGFESLVPKVADIVYVGAKAMRLGKPKIDIIDLGYHTTTREYGQGTLGISRTDPFWPE